MGAVVQLISGVMLGFEFSQTEEGPEEGGGTVLILDLLVFRVLIFF